MAQHKFLGIVLNSLGAFWQEFCQLMSRLGTFWQVFCRLLASTKYF